jgi:hypothetical protein
MMASIGGCSAVPLDEPVVINTDKTYDITSVSGNKGCGEGQLTISVAGAPDNGSYKWYESLDSPAAIEGQSGSQFITPVLNKTKTYYVAAVNSLGCEGTRNEVLAEIVYYEEVSITLQEQQLISSYASGNQWYFNGEPIAGGTNQTILATETGLYEVEVTTTGGCTTRTSQEMIVMGTEQPFEKGFQVYPNPVDDKLTIEIPNTDPASAVILSNVGKSIGAIQFRNTGSKMTGEYNLGGQASGLYFVRIFQGNKIINYKVIKK